MSTFLATTGVGILLGAYVAALLRHPPKQRLLAALNAVGAALACAASVMIGFLPFVVLEAIWALVAAVELVTGPESARR